jgi:hypothetical protein
MRKRSLLASGGALCGRPPSRARLTQAVRLKADKKPPARRRPEASRARQGHQGGVEGQVSTALEVVIQPRATTLTEAEIEALTGRITAAAAKAGATLRG